MAAGHADRGTAADVDDRVVLELRALREDRFERGIGAQRVVELAGGSRYGAVAFGRLAAVCVATPVAAEKEIAVTAAHDA